jgi:hypothetical protein
MEERTVVPAMLNPLTLEELCRCEIESNCLGDLVKALFSQAIADHQRLEFTQLSAALRYLQVSLTVVLLDTFRAHTRPRGIPPSEPDNSGELRLEDDMDGRQLWERIQHLFPDSREQRVAFLLFHCNLSPSDILRYAPQEFRDKQEICHLRSKILQRILLHSDLTC